MMPTESGQLRVGAAKVDIMPPEDALPSDYKSVHITSMPELLCLTTSIPKPSFWAWMWLCCLRGLMQN
jgi:hypothetical protein